MMTRGFWMTLGIGGILLLAGVSTPARAQVVYSGQTAFQNLATSLSDEHRPGSMVVSGLARAQSAVRNPAAPFEITETEPIRSPAQELRIEAITVVLDELSDFWNFLLVQYLQRAGFDVELPDDSNSSGNGDSSGDGNGGSGRGDSTTDGGKDGGRKSTSSPRAVLPRPRD